MNKNLNLEDVQKFTKYYLKTGALTGGANSTASIREVESKKQIYGEKMKEYTTRLKKSGVDTNQLIKIIQSGGTPSEDLAASKAKINDAIEKIKSDNNYTTIDSSIKEIKEKMDQYKKTYLNLKKDHNKYITEVNEYLNNLQTKLETEGNNSENNKNGIRELENILEELKNINFEEEEEKEV
jgi:hypothetical protein